MAAPLLVWCDSEFPGFRLRKESLLLVYRIPHFLPLPVLEERVAEELAEDVAEERQCNQKAHIFPPEKRDLVGSLHKC